LKRVFDIITKYVVHEWWIKHIELQIKTLTLHEVELLFYD
jgi:hypothetical protein